MKKILFAIPFLIFVFFVFIYKRTLTVSSGDGTPLDVLKKRYAQGDITKKEYEEMIKELEE
jgi:uncharacterized membrane protein